MSSVLVCNKYWPVTFSNGSTRLEKVTAKNLTSTILPAFLFQCFQLSDRNECEEWGFCDQKCENIDFANADGNYKCSCVEGYDLNTVAGVQMCQAKKSFPKMNVMFTNTNAIYMMDPTSNRNNLHEILSNATSASGLDFHYKKKLLFYTDVDKRKVFQMHFDETGKSVTHKRDYR